MSEIVPSPEQNPRREQFLADLGGFLIEAGDHGWAADAPKVKNPQRPGFKELSYTSGDWEYRDSYAGYYMAPGSSVVYLKDRPVWYMTYGGKGQNPRYLERTSETYDFLKKALWNPEPALPIRGPLIYDDIHDAHGDSGLTYYFRFDGSLAEAHWDEEVLDYISLRLFSQRGDVGIIVDKRPKQSPLYPWDL